MPEPVLGDLDQFELRRVCRLCAEVSTVKRLNGAAACSSSFETGRNAFVRTCRSGSMNIGRAEAQELIVEGPDLRDQLAGFEAGDEVLHGAGFFGTDRGVVPTIAVLGETSCGLAIAAVLTLSAQLRHYC